MNFSLDIHTATIHCNIVLRAHLLVKQYCSFSQMILPEFTSPNKEQNLLYNLNASFSSYRNNGMFEWILKNYISMMNEIKGQQKSYTISVSKEAVIAMSKE